MFGRSLSAKLTPLEDLAKYIKSNKRLPGVPSSDEVARNGIELGSMNAKLLEKIEELHLYILQQQNEATQQQQQITLQQKQITHQQNIATQQQKQIDELKVLVLKAK